MEEADGLPPSSPPPAPSSPPPTPYQPYPGFDYASASLPYYWLDFMSVPSSFDFASSTPLSASSLSTPAYTSLSASLDSPSFGHGAAWTALGTTLLPQQTAPPESPSISSQIAPWDFNEPRPYREIPCDLCGRVIHCPKASIGPLRTHRNSNDCKRRVKKAQREREQTAAAAAREAIVSSLQSTEHTPSTTPRSSSDICVLRGWELARSQRRARSNSRSHSLAHGPRSSSLPADTLFSPFTQETGDEEIAAPSLTDPCPGFILEWAAPESYPWGIYASNSRMNIPYRLERFSDDGNQLCARSVNCTGSRGILQPECASCLSVKLGQTLINLEFQIPGAFVHPLDAEIEESKHLQYDEYQSLRAKHVLHVWAVQQEDLLAVVSTVYDVRQS
ncbi:hypothetical protein R3P38DRAFT_3229966 [Favolaschia claudopus]|uniref:Uncharacterized protein n=1 Tax=Favolaschia claudopus TaxID=2862362 RepID=A0AAV9ZMW9_9AGAR